MLKFCLPVGRDLEIGTLFEIENWDFEFIVLCSSVRQYL
jgi:hypothetical protein